ncbi:cytochrome o ubiquinol oxidase subunit IV [Sphingomonas sp. KRR8]|uniref:cytochrome o ubiquinol oxidase subunit IV n=1 Tax=Sphingomonas sp. KRR8 TaxID=2942996 RepID=UPI0020200C69|nr:cytochrome o ubiquinol oxidase subunit IV [Sphingomonas sp. KRR8]URD60757.1 cytochrome o ubiquinol oxidase subunit IV [Sphingomonas sp. KRR8]
MSAGTDPELHAHGDEHGHGSRKSYLLGFALSAVLTLIPFWLVMTRPGVGATAIVLIVILLAIVQILVHTVSFLHVTTTGEGGWTLLAYTFTGVLLLITIIGSLWIMYHLNSNMMPGMGATSEANSTL